MLTTETKLKINCLILLSFINFKYAVNSTWVDVNTSNCLLKKLFNKLWDKEHNDSTLIYCNVIWITLKPLLIKLYDTNCESAPYLYSLNIFLLNGWKQQTLNDYFKSHFKQLC